MLRIPVLLPNRAAPRLSCRSAPALAVCLVAFCAGASCAELADLLDPVTVTGARLAVPVSETLQDVTVIDRSAIDAHAGASIESLLAEQAGIQISSYGGMGAANSVFIRGANANSTLLLIDGMRYGSATSGGPVFYNLPLDQIDHIEIVRGPLSALYGSEAGGGVIQVFTRRGQSGTQADASLTLGTEHYRSLATGVRGSTGGLDYALQLGGQRTAGYPFTNANAGYSFNPNADGFSQSSASLNLGYAVAPGWSLRAQGLGARGNGDYADGFDPARPDLTARNVYASSAGSLTLTGTVSPGWSTSLRLGSSRDDYNSDVAVNAYMLGRFTTQQQQLGWQNDLQTPVGTLLAGAEHLSQAVGINSTVPPTILPVDRRTVDSLLLGLTGSSGRHSWQVNGRADRNTQFGRAFTGAAAYGFAVTPSWRLSASAGSSFVMPSFNDLYYPGSSNPALQPQRGDSDELAIAWREGGRQLRAGVYDNRFHDLIAYVGTSYTPANVGLARIQGLTVAYSDHLGPVALSSAFDWMDPRDLSDGTWLARRSRTAWSAQADWNLARDCTLGARIRGAGARYDDAANATVLSGYGLVSLFGNWQWRPAWQFALRVDNAGNRTVQPSYGYNAPPRQWFLSLRYGD